MFAGGRRVNLNLFAACICYIVATSFLEQHREGARLQRILFQICYEYKVCRLNNILIIGNPRDTDIRQCIHNQTNLIFIGSRFDNALSFVSERMQDGVGLGQVKNTLPRDSNPVTKVDGMVLIKILQSKSSSAGHLIIMNMCQNVILS